MVNITLITGNKNKTRELGGLLGVKLSSKKLDIPEVQSADTQKVALAKAKTAYKVLGAPVIVDDTSLVINAWGQLPGAFIRWFLDDLGNEGILRMLDGFSERTAIASTVLGYCDKDGVKTYSAEVKGIIVKKPRGVNGFGFDPIFIPRGSTKTFAEMSDKEKNAISMRKVAAQKLRQDLFQ